MQNSSLPKLPKHGQTAISTEHERLETNRTAEFADWIDSQLRLLEQRFASSITHQSMKQSFGR